MGIHRQNDGVGFTVIMDIKVIPGILEQKIEEVEKKIERIRGLEDEVLIDIIDGKYVDNKTIEVDALASIQGLTSLGVQLMVEEPIEHLSDCAEVGVDLAIGHVELMKDQMEFVNKARSLQILPGLGLDLKTSIDNLEEEALSKVSEVLLMAVPAGHSGQEFDSRVLDKIRSLRKNSRLRTLNIWVDGGVNAQTIEQCVKVGANRLSVTSGIFKDGCTVKQIGKLNRLARLAARS